MSALVWLLVGCGLAPPVPTADSGVRFPHAEGYDAAALHGAEALTVGTAACDACHREDTTAPTCASCHEGYPHPVGWLAGATHGVGLTGDGGATGRAPCAECHGVDGSRSPSCTSCHTSYPHVDGWDGAGQHGAWVRARGSATAACGSCHGAALEGSVTAPACTECHAAWPHPEGYADPRLHGVADLTTCATCHGADLSGGSAGVACAQCHAGFPHSADWGRAHMPAVELQGQSSCMVCHDEGAAPTLPAACGARCHGGPP